MEANIKNASQDRVFCYTIAGLFLVFRHMHKVLIGATENAGVENAGALKMQGV